MHIILRLTVFIACCLLPFSGFTQSSGGKGGAPVNEHHEKRKKERTVDKEKARKEGLKRHEEIQDKKTRKRMKESRKKSERLRENKRDPFYKRWFTK